VPVRQLIKASPGFAVVDVGDLALLYSVQGTGGVYEVPWKNKGAFCGQNTRDTVGYARLNG